MIGVTITIMRALRSLRYSILILAPNAFPTAMTAGIWAITVGEVNLAAASVFNISLGIVVDDTVHFISKYRRAYEQKNMTREQAIHYAFENVGSALVTSAALGIGFGLPGTSDFEVNGHIGTMTAMTVFIALAFDFLILLSLLMIIDRKKSQPERPLQTGGG